MRFSSKLILAATIFVSSAYAYCYPEGPKWINREYALSSVEQVCDYFIRKGVLERNGDRTYPIVNLL